MVADDTHTGHRGRLRLSHSLRSPPGMILGAGRRAATAVAGGGCKWGGLVWAGTPGGTLLGQRGLAGDLDGDLDAPQHNTNVKRNGDAESSVVLTAEPVRQAGACYPVRGPSRAYLAGSTARGRAGPR